MKNLENKFGAGRILFLPLAILVSLGLTPSRTRAQFNPNELPMELRGFVNPASQADEIEKVFAFNNSIGLAVFSYLPYDDTVSTSNKYRFLIPSDIEGTPEIEGARSGDTIYFVAVKPGDPVPIVLEPSINPVTHDPGQISHIDLSFNTTDVEDNGDFILPSNFVLYQNYPNPFNSSTNLRYDVKRRAKVTLNLYDISGRKIETLIDKEHSVGEYFFHLDGNDLASGVYLLNMEVDGARVSSRKMIHLK